MKYLKTYLQLNESADLKTMIDDISNYLESSLLEDKLINYKCKSC